MEIMNSNKKYEEQVEQEFFWNDVKEFNPPQNKVSKTINKKLVLEYLNNLIFAVKGDERLLEQLKQVKDYVRENNI